MPRRCPRKSQKEMPSLAQVSSRPRKASRQSRPWSERVPPEILRLITCGRRSRSEPLVWSGTSGRSSTTSNSSLLAYKPLQQPVERGEAGTPTEDPVEAGAQRCPPARVRVAATGLEVGVEPPDQAALALLGGVLAVGEGVELVDQSLRVHPAQSMAI